MSKPRKKTTPAHGLDAALANLDALPILQFDELARRVARAGTCHNYGDKRGERREMSAALALVAYRLGIECREMDRLIQEPQYHLARTAGLDNAAGLGVN